MHWDNPQMLEKLHFVKPFYIRFGKSTRRNDLIMINIIVKTQRNSTQLNSTQSNSKATSLRLDIVVTWNPPAPPHHPQTFKALLDQLES